MTHLQLQAHAEQERRRMESLSMTIGEADINVARYHQWALMHTARWLRDEGIEIDARAESDFLRSEVERFQAWSLKQAAVAGLDKLSDDELLDRYHQSRRDLITHYEKGRTDETTPS